ncbi:BatD family protein [Fulvivirgaceae bacterium BMA12]|uniref:BatD family protein n=1 Tax=Agaribacillus aureus TaxID=3051825 RepID=A0ABT8LF75_9BACT|nr:BatD family protein [Fulvivirgaceae bacterium BMA12]
MRHFLLRSGLLLLLGFGTIDQAVLAQEVSLELGPDEIARNQSFTITITVHNERLKDYDDFPEIEGFRKLSTTSSSNTTIINGQISSSQSTIQQYAALREGTFRLKPFTMTVNGKKLSSSGKSIKVGPPSQRTTRSDPFSNNIFDEYFGRSSGEEEFMDVKADAFLALTTDKDEVYLGEGFTTTLAFYVSEANRAELEFYDLSKQVSEATKLISPTNCWEESFSIENIKGELVVLNKKRYMRYKLLQSTYYPWNLEPIELNSVPLQLIKYKVSKKRSFFGRSKKEDFQTFYSLPKIINVKDLPPHPLKDQVAVGDYYLKEKVSPETTRTGESFSYSFRIFGEGNISAINNPEIPEDEIFDFYPPNVQQNIKRGNGKVSGVKQFNYYGIPNEPGTYNLNDYFSWVFFNTKLDQYDTLSSNIIMQVSGESKRNLAISSNDLGSFYDIIDIEDNKLTSRIDDVYTKIFANIFILIMLVLSLIFIFRK